MALLDIVRGLFPITEAPIEVSMAMSAPDPRQVAAALKAARVAMVDAIGVDTGKGDFVSAVRPARQQVAISDSPQVQQASSFADRVRPQVAANTQDPAAIAAATQQQ